jgi:superfamily II DNA/RNA helicase
VKVNYSYGKIRMDHTMESLRQGCDILVVSPGRGGHLIADSLVDVTELKFLVLDEADELLHEDFREQMDKIFNNLPTVSTCEYLE